MNCDTNKFDTEFNKILAPYLGKVLTVEECFVLRCVSLAFKELAEIVMDHVTALTLKGSLINSPGALQVLKGRGKKIKYLNCSTVRSIPEETFLDLTSGMMRLEDVNLNCVEVSPAALIPILTASEHLFYINFSGCNWFNDEALGVLARHQKKLQYADLHGCKQLSKKALIELVVACTEALQLIFNQIPSVDNEVIEAVAANCPKLKWLHLASCSNVADADIGSFKQQRPEVTVKTREFDCGFVCPAPPPPPPLRPPTQPTSPI